MLQILLVDDEITERRGLRFLIGKYSFPLEVHEAENGIAALEYIKTHGTDIVLTDVKMPFMDGLELAKAISETYPRIKIIIFSAYGEFDYAKKAFEVKALNYLLKPIEVDEFRKVMGGVIALCEKEKSSEMAAAGHDRDEVLAYLLTASQIDSDFYEENLRKHGISFFEFKRLVSIESNKNFFNFNGAYFLNELKRKLTCPFEYISLSPIEACLIVHSRVKPDKDELGRLLSALCAKIHRDKDVKISAIIGGVFKSVKDFPINTRELQSTRAELFYYNSSVIFTEQLKEIREKVSLEADHIVMKLDASMENKDPDEMERQIEELVCLLCRQPAMSYIYTHHLFWEILNKIFKSFQIQDSAWLNQKISRLIQSKTIDEINELMKESINEVRVNQPKEQTLSDAVEIVLRIIKTEYRQNLDLEYLASRVYLTPSYLSYLFRQQTGETIVRYITKFRIEKAKKLLEDGAMKIADISRECGYDDPSYFNRLFKNICGITPKQYRGELNARS